MIVDTSAVVAVIRQEPGSEALSAAMAAVDDLVMSAATYVELFAVAGRTPTAASELTSVLDAFGIEVIAFDDVQARVAASAYQRYGRGSGHPAHLNLGDTYSYALAWIRDEPLLFVGDDFVHTDVRRPVA